MGKSKIETIDLGELELTKSEVTQTETSDLKGGTKYKYTFELGDLKVVITTADALENLRAGAKLKIVLQDPQTKLDV